MIKIYAFIFLLTINILSLNAKLTNTVGCCEDDIVKPYVAIMKSKITMMTDKCKSCSLDDMEFAQERFDKAMGEDKCDYNRFKTVKIKQLEENGGKCSSIMFGRSKSVFKDGDSDYNSAGVETDTLSHEALNNVFGQDDVGGRLVDNAFTYLFYGPFINNAVFRMKGMIDDTLYEKGSVKAIIDSFYSECLNLPFFSCFEFKYFSCNTKANIWLLMGEKSKDDLATWSKNNQISDNVFKYDVSRKKNPFCKNKLNPYGLIIYSITTIGFSKQMISMGQSPFNNEKTIDDFVEKYSNLVRLDKYKNNKKALNSKLFELFNIKKYGY